MDKIELVEESYRNGEEIVFYDEESDTIWVCFDGCVVKNDLHNTIIFKDCSRAIIEDDQKEYYGEVENESYNLTYRCLDKVCELFIPTRLFENELFDKERIF